MIASLVPRSVRPLVLKSFFADAGDARDRAHAELASYFASRLPESAGRTRESLSDETAYFSLRLLHAESNVACVQRICPFAAEPNLDKDYCRTVMEIMATFGLHVTLVHG